MKKILSIALVALLAVSSAFAGITGDATIGFGYDINSGAIGYSNDKTIKVNFDFASGNGEYPVPVVEEVVEEVAEEVAE